ncbi:MAG: cation:dicarboxylase symporter family transporter, partial [Phenylobacterium sp.]|nr:cation:dicarboxylase symporter family transporter [Phenylobacterium sp.]
MTDTNARWTWRPVHVYAAKGEKRGGLMKWWFGSALWMRILLGMALGVAVGFALRPGGLAMAAGVDVQAVDAGLKLIGDAFIRLIRMLAVPLIFVSVTAAV